MSCEQKFNAAVNVIRSLPKNGKCTNFTHLCVNYDILEYRL